MYGTKLYSSVSNTTLPLILYIKRKLFSIMSKSTAEITKDYINNHPHLKHCLKKGLINYSALARHISFELKIEKHSSKEAILVACRRLHDKLESDISNDKNIEALLSKSEMEIKNRIVVYVLEKNMQYNTINSIQTQIKKESGYSFFIEGSANYTFITQEKYSSLVNLKLKSHILQSKKDLVLLNIK